MIEAPYVGTVADRHVHPATVPLRFLKEAPSTLLGLPAVFAYVSDVGWASVLAFAGLAAAGTIFFNWLTWRRFRYGIGEVDIVIERGLLNRTRRSIPFARVQDVDIERGPLQRLFGLAKVRIETGGSGKDEGVLDSVSVAEADRLRTLIRARQAGADQAADRAVPDTGWDVFRMSIGRVLASGLFNFSLLWIASLFALLQTFESWLPFDIYDPGRWLGLVDGGVSRRLTLGAAMAVLFIALLLGVATGIVRTLSRDYGFRLSVEERRFRRERGLFTRTEMVIPEARIQLARVGTGPLRRALGWFELSMQTLSLAKGGGGRQSAAPLATRGEISAILREMGGLSMPPPSELTMVSSRHLVRVFVVIVLVPLVAILALAAFRPLALILLLLLPFLIASAFLERRFHRYALRDGLLFIQRGVWRQRLWIVPVAKVRTIGLGRSFLQRRLGLATLSVDTAGASPLDPPRIVDMAEAKARLLMRQLSGRKSGTDR